MVLLCAQLGNLDTLFLDKWEGLLEYERLNISDQCRVCALHHGNFLCDIFPYVLTDRFRADAHLSLIEASQPWRIQSEFGSTNAFGTELQFALLDLAFVASALLALAAVVATWEAAWSVAAQSWIKWHLERRRCLSTMWWWRSSKMFLL